jgi:DNA-directed RNA polymerase subunit M/transcription elongation factor TFIIS
VPPFPAFEQWGKVAPVLQCQGDMQAETSVQSYPPVPSYPAICESCGEKRAWPATVRTQGTQLEIGMECQACSTTWKERRKARALYPLEM